MLDTNPIAEGASGIISTMGPAEPQVEAFLLDAGAHTPTTSSSWCQKATGRSKGPPQPEKLYAILASPNVNALSLSPQSLHAQLESRTLRPMQRLGLLSPSKPPPWLAG
jgi:hypothetical protein